MFSPLCKKIISGGVFDGLKTPRHFWREILKFCHDFYYT
jgi:hypothetical protein